MLENQAYEIFKCPEIPLFCVAAFLPLIFLIWLVFCKLLKSQRINEKLIEDNISLKKRMVKRYELYNELAHVNSDLSIEKEIIEKKYDIISDKIIEFIIFIKNESDILDGVEFKVDGEDDNHGNVIEALNESLGMVREMQEMVDPVSKPDQEQKICGDTANGPTIITMVGTDSGPIFQE
jgi:hypothetical protein